MVESGSESGVERSEYTAPHVILRDRLSNRSEATPRTLPEHFHLVQTTFTRTPCIPKTPRTQLSQVPVDTTQALDLPLATEPMFQYLSAEHRA